MILSEDLAVDVNQLMSNFHLRRWSLTVATSVGA